MNKKELSILLKQLKNEDLEVKDLILLMNEAIETQSKKIEGLENQVNSLRDKTRDLERNRLEEWCF